MRLEAAEAIFVSLVTSKEFNQTRWDSGHEKSVYEDRETIAPVAIPLIVAIGIASLLEARKNANEAAAIGSLQGSNASMASDTEQNSGAQ
jgi:hypothetical protein